MNRKELHDLRRQSFLAMNALYVAVLEGVYDDCKTGNRLAVASEMHKASCRELHLTPASDIPESVRHNLATVECILEEALQGGEGTERLIRFALQVLRALGYDDDDEDLADLGELGQGDADRGP